MATHEGNLPVDTRHTGRYIFNGQAAATLSEAVGLDLSEGHILKISKAINVKSFKIGVRIAFEREEFEANFDKFVTISASQLDLQIAKRRRGATNFNDKIDAIFAYLEFVISNDATEAFSAHECVRFMKCYNEELYKDFTIDDLSVFLRKRRDRMSSVERRKGIDAGNRLLQQRDKEVS